MARTSQIFKINFYESKESEEYVGYKKSKILLKQKVNLNNN